MNHSYARWRFSVYYNVSLEQRLDGLNLFTPGAIPLHMQHMKIQYNVHWRR
jgi:hypothetical protein